MHIIDAYLKLKDFSYDWNNLNPEYFTYQNVYYPNVLYKDVLGTGKFKDEIYFVDNYARTNEGKIEHVFLKVFVHVKIMKNIQT